jgi:glycosyltransferase involved in cell wall biosynthesis
MRRSFRKFYFEQASLPDFVSEINFPQQPNLLGGHVTIVMAAYLRAEVMRVAIESVIGQTFSRWKLIVIGDSTYLETKRVIDSMNDTRIEYFNLPRRFGDQSLLNSIGARMSDTEYLAFLNQDDIWLPKHLENAIAVLGQSTHDFVLAPYLRAQDIKVGEIAPLFDNGFLPGKDQYSPARDWDYPASTWVLRTSLTKRVGDWKSGREVRYSASQEYLFRCWASGARIFHLREKPSVVMIPSIHIKNSYISNQSIVHRVILRRIQDGEGLAPASKARGSNSVLPSKVLLISRAWLSSKRGRLVSLASKIGQYFLFHSTVSFAARLGFAPWEYAVGILGIKKGFHKRRLDEVRGLSSIQD